jgi:hypothetical protein
MNVNSLQVFHTYNQLHRVLRVEPAQKASNSGNGNNQQDRSKKKKVPQKIDDRYEPGSLINFTA